MTSSSFPHRPPGADEVGPGRSVDDHALNPAVPTTTDYQTITKPPQTANPNPDTKLKMPETAATRKAQVVPLLGSHDEPEPEASSSSSAASSSRPSDENQHNTSIDSLAPLTPGLIPANQHHNSSFVEEDDLTTGKYALRSWLTVLGAWLAIFSSFGLLTVLSICQNYVSAGDNEEQVASISEGTLAWVFSLYFVVSLGLGMYVGPLSDRFGARWMVLSGTVFLGVGMVVLACRSETWAILLAFGILSGLTSTFLFIPSLVTIHQFFSRSPRYYTFATSLATTAGPTAGIVFPYATRNLFHEVNWPWTIRTLGLICFFLAVIANFLIRSPPFVPTSPASSSLGKKGKKSRTPSPPPGSSASSASSSASDNSTTPMVVGGPSAIITPSASARPALVGKLASAPHPSLTPFFFSSPSSYTLLFLSLLLIHLSIYTTTTYLSATSLFSQGYSHSFTFRTSTLVVNISSIGGRLLAGLLASGSPFWSSSSASTKPPSKAGGMLKGLGAFNTTILFSLLATLSLLAVLLPPILHPGRVGMSPSRFTAFAVLFGLSSGAVLGLEPVLVSLVCGTNNNNSKTQFGQYFGTLYTIISLASIAGIPIGSHLINACRGMYWGLVVFVGVSFGVGMLGLLLVRRSVVNQTGDNKKGKKSAAAAAVAGDDERIDDGLRGFEWKKLSLWKERKTWSELTERVGRSWGEVWGLERV